MNILQVTSVRINAGSAEKGRQIFVHEDILKRRNHESPRSLKNLLVTPRSVLLLDAPRHLVVPAQKENRERQKRRILISARIAENWKSESD